jgi:hypothetical protein
LLAERKEWERNRTTNRNQKEAKEISTIIGNKIDALVATSIEPIKDVVQRSESSTLKNRTSY